jgi:hypothetical protein
VKSHERRQTIQGFGHYQPLRRSLRRIRPAAAALP